MIKQNNQTQSSIGNNYEIILQQIGMTESQTKLYLAALELGAANVVELSLHAGLSRQMAYLLLPAMQAKGLIQQIKFGRKVHYKALSPKLLRGIVEKISQQIEYIIPALSARQPNQVAVPLLTVYENPLAMREWYGAFMKKAKKGDELLVYSSGLFWHWYDLDANFYDKFLKFSDRK